jgi:hypothetical protein
MAASSRLVTRLTGCWTLRRKLAIQYLRQPDLASCADKRAGPIYCDDVDGHRTRAVNQPLNFQPFWESLTKKTIHRATARGQAHWHGGQLWHLLKELGQRLGNERWPKHASAEEQHLL